MTGKRALPDDGPPSAAGHGSAKHALSQLRQAHGHRYWIRLCGRMWIATARMDDGTEPTIIRESADDLATAMESPAPRIGRWEPLR